MLEEMLIWLVLGFIVGLLIGFSIGANNENDLRSL